MPHRASPTRRDFLKSAAVLAAAPLASASPSPRVVVEAEEEVYRFTDPDNGSGPLWCHGSTCLVRQGDDVFASGLQTLPGVKPLNNCRWLLFHRGPGGWKQVQADPSGRTREPSPLAAFPDGRLFLSVNPTATDPATYSGPARPDVLEFTAADPAAAGRSLAPRWAGTPVFSEHSYRTLAADGPGRELILFQNVDYTHAEWTFRDRDGRWSAQGRLAWPQDTDHGPPRPVRVCYPNVLLRGRAVHFCGVSDIIEPNATWRAYKKKLTGRDWDYDFRRLSYTWTPDVTKEPFRPWVEVASRDRTAGWITPGDLWPGTDGRVHVVWEEKALDERLRQEFFPREKQAHAVGHAVLQDGRVLSSRPLVLAEEGKSGEVPGNPRVQVTEDGRAYLFYFVSGSDAQGRSLSENRLLEIGPDGAAGPAVRVPLARPFYSFFTATPRAGSAPGRTLDILGQRTDKPKAMSYGRVRIVN